MQIKLKPSSDKKKKNRKLLRRGTQGRKRKEKEIPQMGKYHLGFNELSVCC
jgi:hypothetical protein